MLPRPRHVDHTHDLLLVRGKPGWVARDRRLPNDDLARPGRRRGGDSRCPPCQPGARALPGGRAEVPRAKWVGSVAWCRWPAWGLLTIWVLGVLTGGLPLAAL